MRKMRVAIVTLPLALVLAVAAAPGTTTTSSGLRGVVSRGPITPVCAAEVLHVRPGPPMELAPDQ